MYRVTVMSGTAYAVDIGEDFKEITESDMENIDILVNGGNPVIICEEIEELEAFGITKVELA